MVNNKKKRPIDILQDGGDIEDKGNENNTTWDGGDIDEEDN